MFCPQCGQQQATSDVRFCPRCGFQLAGVAGLIATGGATHADLTQGALVGDTPRRKGARLGGKLMLFGIFLAPALAMLSEITGTPDELAMFGMIVFLAGLLRLVYAAIFEDGPFRRQAKQPSLYAPPAAQGMFAPPASAASLPPARSVPAGLYAPPRGDTAEIVYRPSVTEGTTRLLDEERDSAGALDRNS